VLRVITEGKEERGPQHRNEKGSCCTGGVAKKLIKPTIREIKPICTCILLG
jgi:hypothetical protein